MDCLVFETVPSGNCFKFPGSNCAENDLGVANSSSTAPHFRSHQTPPEAWTFLMRGRKPPATPRSVNQVQQMPPRLITTIFPRIYARTYYAHPRARVMFFSALCSFTTLPLSRLRICRPETLLLLFCAPPIRMKEAKFCEVNTRFSSIKNRPLSPKVFTSSADFQYHQ